MASLQEIVAEEWRSRAPELADWAMQRLVNRRDVWGQYSVLTPTEKRRSGKSYKAMTLPAVDSRDESAFRVTLDKLTRHFASRKGRKPQLIGLHAKSQLNTSRWFGIDLDNHNPNGHADDDLSRRNLNAAVAWYQQLQQLGFDPLLIDSNGAGGYHLWVLFEEPAATEFVHAFAMDITSNWAALELDKQPEVFPKKQKEGSLGSWFRLPGLHHSLNHHARIWQGEEGLDEPWLAGHAAVDAMLSCVPGPPPPSQTENTVKGSTRSSTASLGDPRNTVSAKDTDAQPGDSLPSSGRKRFTTKNRSRVCVDFDGVLAMRTGTDSLGPPIDGAVEFTRTLHTTSDIIIYTARFGTKAGKARSAKSIESLKQRIERWLSRYGFAWDSICTDVAKPIAVAYIDDRAVPCRPESLGLVAYEKAIATTQSLSDGALD